MSVMFSILILMYSDVCIFREFCSSSSMRLVNFSFSCLVICMALVFNQICLPTYSYFGTKLKQFIAFQGSINFSFSWRVICMALVFYQLFRNQIKIIHSLLRDQVSTVAFELLFVTTLIMENCIFELSLHDIEAFNSRFCDFECSTI